MKKLVNLQKIVFITVLLSVATLIAFLSKPVDVQTQTVTKVIDNARFE